MTIPVTSLDDRKFDDLVKEARERLEHHLPEMDQLTEGDPLYALVDLFAWMTESVIYRANLIPERQRQAFLNLLQLPRRAALPATGIVSIDTKIGRGSQLAPLLQRETQLSAGNVIFSTVGELQSLPLALVVMIKERISDAQLASLDINANALQTLYNTQVSAFVPRSFDATTDQLDLAHSLDKCFYLLAYLPHTKQLPQKDSILQNLTAQIISIGIVPVLDEQGASVTDITENQALSMQLAPRELRWEIAWQQTAEQHKTTYIPLEIVADTSKGGRVTGVVKLRLPNNSAILNSQFSTDPQYAGYANTPPEPPAHISAEQSIFWIRLSAPLENDFSLDYIGINAVDVIAQGVIRDQMVAIANGQPEQSYSLNIPNIEAASLEIEVSEIGNFKLWQQVSDFNASGAEDKVYRFDSATALVVFGDGLKGKRPSARNRIRARYYRHGGGIAGNLSAASISQIVNASSKFLVRHDWPTTNGRDGESVASAEQRIPAHLKHRNRAVTQDDFIQLALANPVNPVARAEVIQGLQPGSSLDTVQQKVPGVVSVFVLPPSNIAFGEINRPTAGLLRDLYQYLDSRTLLGTELYVLSPEFIGVAIGLVVQVLDATVITQTLNAVNKALLHYLWITSPAGPSGNGWPMGRNIEINELKAVAARVAGVLAIGELTLFRLEKQGQWQNVAKVSLLAYQLPQIMQVDAIAGDSQTKARVPAVVAPDNGDNSVNGATPIAVPVIPDVC
ncbi:MAG: putative baseplate assembly protein [Oceanospirillaceae bacterium]